MFCGQCGNQISDTAKFCNKCGWKIPQNENAGEVVVTAPEAETKEAVEAKETKRKSKKGLVWLIIVLLILALGGTATVLYLKYAESVEEEDEDSDDEEESDDEDSDDEDSPEEEEEQVSSKKKANDASMIGSTMDVLEVVACDPALYWATGEVIYVKFTSNGAEYGSNNSEVVEEMESILPSDIVRVSAWADGFELWGKKTEYGYVEFATSFTFEEIEEVSADLAYRFYMTSVEP